MTRRYVLGAALCAGAGALICALVVATISTNLPAGPGDDVRARIDTQLAVQKALQEGLDQIQRGNYQAAVVALEKEVARIDGNRKYLDALTTAYRGYIRDLQKGNRAAEVEVYRRRLEILDPSARPERPTEQVVSQPVSPEIAPPTEPVPTLGEVLAKAAPLVMPIGLDGYGPTKPTPPAAPGVVRAKIDESPAKSKQDPADSVAGKSARAAAQIEQATQEFLAKHYAEAGRCYELADKLDAGATANCREQWGYCKMYSASEAVRKGPSGVAAQDLEREIRQAMAMTPKLESFGKSLLKMLQDRTTPTAASAEKIDENFPVEMKHTPRQGSGWAIVETSNFRILHNQPREVAEKAARVAEATRLAMSRKWFGDDGELWNPRCDVYLYANGEEYNRATSVPASSPGHSTMTADGNHVTARRIDLHVDHPETFRSVLPHEATHVVLAGRFDGPVPRWADEGMAVLTEPPNRVERYTRNFPRHDQDHLLFGVGQLMRLNDYPDPRLVDPFYTESVSLVDFLSKEKGPKEFTAFLRDGMRDGYEVALRKHFGIESFSELERRWRGFAFTPTQPTAVEIGK